MTLFLLLACTPSKPTPAESAADTAFDSGFDSGFESGGDSGSDTGTAIDATPTSVLVDPTCTDGAFAEEIPDTAEDLSDLVAAYDPSGTLPFIQTALERRFPLGLWLIAGGAEPIGEDCDAYILAHYGDGEADTVPFALLVASVVVHECGHFYDLSAQTDTARGYILNTDTTLMVSGISPPDAPARSRILGDTWVSARPPCPELGSNGCDGYADPYLVGDPDDEEFDSGDQGFDLLVEEWVQYNHSLETALAFSDQILPATYRDGVLTMMWYVERYLAYWRVTDPHAYRTAMVEGEAATAVLTIWGQSWDLVDASEGIDALGYDDEEILPLVEEPALLGEIDVLRGLVGCP